MASVLATGSRTVTVSQDRSEARLFELFELFGAETGAYPVVVGDGAGVVLVGATQDQDVEGDSSQSAAASGYGWAATSTLRRGDRREARTERWHAECSCSTHSSAARAP